MTANEQLVDLFDRFKQAYPHSIETYNPTMDNVRRWQWSLQQADIRQTTERKDFTMPSGQPRAKALARSRAVGVFSRLPALDRGKFLYLAALFPGRRVYATGSRTNGEWVDADSPGSIRQMRADLLKKDVVASDYDIALDFTPDDDIDALRKLLPPWGDLIVRVPDGEPKIEIPMWDFSKLPVELHDEIVDLVERHQWGQLMAIHNDYGLTDTMFCCDHRPAQEWFTYAVNKGIIKRKETPPVPERPTTNPPKKEPG